VDTLRTVTARLKAAGDDTRLRLLALLDDGERTVKDLTDILGQSQPRVSRHLKLLTDSGLVERRPEGSWVYYGLSDEASAKGLMRGILAALGHNDDVLRRDRERLADVKSRNQTAAARYFAEHADEWDRIRSLHIPDKQVEDAILAAAGPGPFRALLDIGTGTGRMLELFADRYDRGLGVDLSQPMLAVARANLERAGIGHARVRLGDTLNLPVPRDSYDLVIFHQVLHYLDEPARAVTEASRAVAPGGRLLIVDFAPHSLEFLREAHAHRRLGFSHRQMAQWIEGSGLTLEKATDLRPDSASAEGLTVTVWLAQDRRIRMAAAGDPLEPGE
jgi:ubiquinone/menaquinone biosynthesis C-methylase UbiE/DNA-binding transcriptional ArsR family regulator